MNNSNPVSSAHHIGDKDAASGSFFHCQTTRSQFVSQCLAFQIFHNDVWSFPMLTDIQNRANAGVIQSGSSSSFLLKSLQGITILAEPIQEEFHRDESAQSDILRLIDNTHTPDANSSENPIMRNCLADHTEVPLSVMTIAANTFHAKKAKTPASRAFWKR